MKRQLKSNRFLPEYVTSFKDRHGKVRLRFRRKGFVSHYFSAALGTEAFRTEYKNCMDPEKAAVASEEARLARAEPGSIDDLVNRYFANPARLGPSEVTQTKVRAVIENFREGREGRPVDLITFEHIDAIIEKKKVKTGTGNKTKGGIHAARKLRKELIRLFDFAVKIGFCKTNPAAQSEMVKTPVAQRTKGFHSWTEAEIAQFRKHHALGTRPRLAMELMLWTSQRRSDAVRMGRQHIVGGRINVSQAKSGKDLWIAVAPQLLEAIVAMPASQRGHLCFLVTAFGAPFTPQGFGNWFRDQCDLAGLPHCSAHGLRKANMRRMADLGLANQPMKSVSGHSKDEEVAHYTAAANQKRMADDAITALARWEMSNLAQGLDTSDDYRFEKEA